MTTPISFVLNYVADPPKSAALYAQLLGAEPSEESPNWVAFYLPNGLMLGLWSRGEVAPKATLPGGNEIGFQVENEAAVNSTRNAWQQLGLKIIQEPTQMDFGYTFTAADPDGHRLRVFAAAAR